MGFKNLKMIINKKRGGGSSEEFVKSYAYDNEETEITLTEEDEPKYSYDDYVARLSMTEEDISKYGYGDTEPAPTISEEDKAKYGYGEEATPTISEEDKAKYGYGEDSCGRSSSQTEFTGRKSWDKTRTPRRSSMKGGSGGPRPNRRRNSLTFSNDVVVAAITPTKDLAKKKSLWFEDKDYEKMHNKIELIVQCAQEGNAEKYCTRGLEGVIKRDSDTIKYDAWDSVLYEQEKQKESGKDFYDDEALAKSYQRASEASCAEARLRAMQDEKDIARYLSETRRSVRRMTMA